MTAEVSLLHGDLQDYLAALYATPLPVGVEYYQVITTARGRQAQEREFNEGDSLAHYGESPHNYSPALALDVVPVVLNRSGYMGTPSVSTKSADYDQIVELARSRGLRSGRDFQDFRDEAHVELLDWRSNLAPGQLPGGGLQTSPPTGAADSRAGGGGVPLLLVLAAVALAAASAER